MLLPLCGTLRASAADVSPLVDEVLSECGERAAVWVFFTDKGLRDSGEIENAMLELEASYPSRAIRRRRLRRSATDLFDVRDVPVCTRYLDGVLATGTRQRTTSRWLNAVSVEADSEQVETIAAMPFVRRIEPVRMGQRLDAVPGEDVEAVRFAPRGGFYGIADNQLQMINIPAMHTAGFTGQGVVIGVLDTGFARTHEAFNNPAKPINVLAEWDFVNDDPDTSFDPNDPVLGNFFQHDHGTWILGTMAAYMPNVMVGGAFDASFILAKTEDISSETQVEEDYYAAGLEFIELHGGDMTTSSLGYIDWYTWFDLDGQTAVTTVAINTAIENGLICVTAVGNGGRDNDFPSLIAPSDAPRIISCGAVDSARVIAGFSSNGPTADGRVKPEVLAQGVSVATVSPHDDTAYQTVSGTSLSTPLVASAVALLIQAHPDWTVDQIREALFNTADYFVANGTFDPNSALGYGIIDADAARQVVFCTGDLNGDAQVDLADLAMQLSGFGITSGATLSDGDVDGDGDVDLADLALLLGNFGTICS